MLQRTLTPLLRALILGSALGASVIGGPTAQAAAPMVKTSAPAYYRTLLGDFEITALSDGTVELPVEKLLKQAPADTGKALEHAYLKAPLETSVNGYLINTGKRLVLIDTGAGGLFGPTLGKLLSNLKSSGYKAEDVDDILITHMHPDHVGGLAANAARVFPNATVHADKRDAEFWLSKENLEKAPADSKGFFQGAMASLQPYVSAGKFDGFDGKTEFTPGITAVPTYGHTPGHTSYLIESKGQKLLVIGDLIHVAAVQFDHPSVTIGFDSDSKAALAQRIKVFDGASQDGTILAAAHIAFPGMGQLHAKGKRYEWIPVNFTQLH